MICNEARELLQGYADDQLLARDKQALEEHLSACAACRAESEKSRENIGFLRERLALLRDAVKADPAAITGLAPPPPPPPPPAPRPVAREKRGAPLALAFLLFATVVFAGVWYFVIRPGRSAPEPVPSPAPGAAGKASGGGVPPPAPVPPRPEPGKAPPGTTDKPPPRPPAPGAATTPEEALARLLSAPSQAALERLSHLLSKAGDPAAQAERMMAALADEKDEVRRACRALALGPVRAEPGVQDSLLALLAGDGSPKVRLAAVAALASGAATAVVPLTAVAPGLSVSAGAVEDEDLRGRLAGALEVEADPAALAAMLRLLGPSAAIDEGIAAKLWELAAAPEDELRQAALAGLRFAPPEADPGAEKLSALLASEQVPLADRNALLQRFAKSGGEGVGARLAELVGQTTDEEWQQALLTALGAPELAPGRGCEVAAQVLRGEGGPGVKAAALRVVAEAARKDDGALSILDEIASTSADTTIAEQARALHTRLVEQRRAAPDDQGTPPPERDPGEEPGDER